MKIEKKALKIIAIELSVLIVLLLVRILAKTPTNFYSEFNSLIDTLIKFIIFMVFFPILGIFVLMIIFGYLCILSKLNLITITMHIISIVLWLFMLYALLFVKGLGGLSGGGH